MVWSATQGSRGCVVRVAPTSFASISSIHYRLLQARGTTKIGFQTQTTPSTFRPSLLKKTLRMDGLFFLECLCLESFCWWQRATQKQKTHQRNRHRGTVLLLELLKCFFYDEGSRIGGNFKKQVKQGRSVVTVIKCNVGIPKGSMGRKVHENLLIYHTNQLFM